MQHNITQQTKTNSNTAKGHINIKTKRNTIRRNNGKRMYRSRKRSRTIKRKEIDKDNAQEQKHKEKTTYK